MKAKILLSVILLTLSVLSGWAHNDNPTNRDTINNIFSGLATTPPNTAHNSNIENWLFGNFQEANNSMIVFFDVQEYEFLEFCTMNNINGFTIKFFTKINEEYLPLGSETIQDVFNDFDASTWSYTVSGFLNNNPVDNYHFQIIVNETICGAMLPLLILEETAEEEEEDLPINLPEFTCGEDYTPIPNLDISPLPNASIGDIFTINGFPILLETVSGSNGTFSGTGILPVPFGRKILSVEFNDVSVSTAKIIYAGQVDGISDIPSNYSDFNLTESVVNIGGDICLPEPPPSNDTGLDDWGFDTSTGIHSETGTLFDNNGFDINGFHQNTGTEYNEAGCNREGIDVDGNICNPSGGTSPEAIAFADSLQSTFATTLEDILGDLQTELQDSIASKDCGSIRTEMETLLTNLQYNRVFIFGEDDKYFKKGMHLEFEQAPKKLEVNINRNPNAVSLEENHIALYDCDKDTYKFEVLLGAVDTLLLELSDQSLVNNLLDRIRNWTVSQYDLYSNDSDKFKEWLIQQIAEILNANSELGDDYTAVENNTAPTDVDRARKSIQSIFDFNSNNLYHNAVASSEKNFLLENTFTLEDASFYYGQGDMEINGFHRALFMEEMAMRRRFVTGGFESLLPLEISKTVGNRSYSIYLDAISFTPTGAALDAYAVIEDPETGKKLVFGAKNLSFGPTGLQSSSSLYLATDVEIRLNNAAMLILKGTQDTYVEWDCEGFKSLGIDAQVEFCRDFITPLEPSTLEPLDEDIRYRVDFKTSIASWLEFDFTINSPAPFAVTKYSDVKWTLNDLILDFRSDETPSFTPLQGYTSPFWDESTETMLPAWKGFYMGELSATFPDNFSNSSDPISVAVTDVLIDGSGFTGAFEVENLISIDEGSMGGWPFSINSFQLKILKNRLSGAGFSGEMNIPILEENLAYEASIEEDNNYTFVVSPTDVVTMNMFLATGEIERDSRVEVKYQNNEFLTTAVLHGKVNVNTANGTGGLNVNLPSLCFQNLTVSNQAPYLNAGTWGLVDQNNNTGATDSKLNGFDIRLSGVSAYNSDDESEAGLDINLDVILSNSIDIKAGGAFSVIGKLEDNNGRHKWVYDRTKMQAFYVDADFTAAHIQGQLKWYGDHNNPDPQWGQGFQGAISANFNKIDLSVDAVAQFGKKDDYKYFFIDALANLSEASIGTGILNIKGFGGGVSYHMNTNHVQVDLSQSGSNDGGLLPLGTSLSGTIYTPSDQYGLGLKATVLLSSAKEEIFNGMVNLSFLFNSAENGGGLNKINLTGSGQFMQKIDLGIKTDFTPDAPNPPESVDAKLSCFIDLEYNFAEPSFHGELNVFLNSSLIKGALPGGKMVDAALHFDPEKWYIYIGRPEEGRQCGVIFTLPSGIGQISAKAYLDIGTEVPPMPPLPNRVIEIAGIVNNNASERISGAGFVFGASVGFDVEFERGKWSAEVEAGAGFDVMLRDYGNASCTGSSGQIGIDGWYARGQLWAYLSGVIKRNGNTKAEVAGAFVLEASLPNPYWIRGSVGFVVQVWIFNFNGNFNVELGDACNVNPIPLTGDETLAKNSNIDLGMDVIAYMDPSNNANGIQPSAVPKAYLNLNLDKDYTIENSAGVSSTFSTKLASISLTSQHGYEILGQVEFNKDKNEIHYRPLSFLPAQDSLTLKAKVIVYRNGEIYGEETKYISFKTAEDLNYIPQTNIAASYPVQGMVNYYKEEYNGGEGYIYLKSGQHELLQNVPNGFVQKIRLTDTDNVAHFIDFEYNSLDNKITFPMNPTILQNEMLYRLELVQLHENKVNTTDNSTDTSSTFFTALTNNSTNINTSPSNNLIDANDTKIIYTMHFRVSKYNTFKEKIAAINAQTGMTKNISALELFDEAETSGENALITLSVDYDNDWINTVVKPKYDDLKIFACDHNVGLEQESDNPVVCLEPASPSVVGTDFDNGAYTFSGNDIINLNLEYLVKERFKERQSKAEGCPSTIRTIDYYLSACAPGDNCAKAEELMKSLTEELPPLSTGTYKVLMHYKIPNRTGGITTTTEVMSFTN